MTDFVRCNEFNETSHQGVGKRERLCAFVEMTHLREIPVALQVHEVVVHLHIGVNDLAGARIGRTRPEGVRNGRRQPAHHCDRCVFAREVGIVGRIGGDDALAESRNFKRGLPLFDATLDPRLEPGRCCRINVVRDRFFRHAQIADHLVRALEPPARDVATRQHALFGRTEIGFRFTEIADARIHESRNHRVVGQAHDREGECFGDSGRTAAEVEAGNVRQATNATALRRVRLNGGDVHVARERGKLVDIGA